MFHTLHGFCLCLWLVDVFGDEVKSVMEGESVTLHTDVKLQSHEEIEWRFNDTRIARIKRSVNINPVYDINEIFRDKLKMDNQTGDLTITLITTQHIGEYKFNIFIASVPNTKKRINVTVNARTAVSESTQTSSSSSSSSESSDITKGSSNYIFHLSCAAAAGFLMIVTLVLIFCICKKHTNKQQQDQTREEEITYADPTFYKHNKKGKRVQKDDEVVYAGVAPKR